jgi:hypothetical protein
MITHLRSSIADPGKIPSDLKLPTFTNKFQQKFYEKTHKFTDAQIFLDRLSEAKVLKKKEQEIELIDLI